MKPVVEAIASKPENGSIKDWMCTWLSTALKMIGDMAHAQGMQVACDPAYPRGFGSGRILSKGNEYDFNWKINALQKGDTLQLDAQLGEDAVGYAKFSKSYPASSFMSVLASDLSEWVKEQLPDLNLASQPEPEGESIKKLTAFGRKLLV